jgi:hypothetical protein
MSKKRTTNGSYYNSSAQRLSTNRSATPMTGITINEETFWKIIEKKFTQISAILYRNDSIIKEMGTYEYCNRALKSTKQNNYYNGC